MPEGSAATAEQTESDVGYDAEMERLCEAEYQRTRRGQWERTQQMRPGPSRDLDGRSERAAKKQRRYEEEIARGQAQRDQRRKDEDAAARAEEEQLKKRRLFELHRELEKTRIKVEQRHKAEDALEAQERRLRSQTVMSSIVISTPTTPLPVLSAF